MVDISRFLIYLLFYFFSNGKVVFDFHELWTVTKNKVLNTLRVISTITYSLCKLCSIFRTAVLTIICVIIEESADVNEKRS